MMCKWLKDEVCVNGDCPAVADFCPVVNHPGVCRYEEMNENKIECWQCQYIDKETFKKSVEERYCKPCKAAKKDYNGCRCRACWVDDMLDDVECFQPADVAPVVRCKDCMHYLIVDEFEGGKRYMCKVNHFSYINSDGDMHYCSYGERKEDKAE